jgi:hypothetical protein
MACNSAPTVRLAMRRKAGARHYFAATLSPSTTAGAVPCLTCHPTDYASYTCYGCHCHVSTATWAQLQFDHANATDCQSCHTSDAPPNHYADQCSNCYTSTTDWTTVQFDHTGLTDCQSCHNGDAPPNHFPGQCSSCHSTMTWAGASFSHTFPLDNGAANGNCQTCHPGDVYTSYTCYDCHNESRTIGEHRDEGITDLSNCVRCHPTGRGEEGGD